MKLHIGVKSDPIEHRHGFDWLFGVMADFEIGMMQLGSFFAMYEVEDSWFTALRKRAEKKGVRIASFFTSHRELSGFMSGDPKLEAATRKSWERLIHVAALAGASSAGSSAGPVMRDRPESKEPGIACYLRHMKELTRAARRAGLSALTVEPMSSVYEWPSTAEEIRRLDRELTPFQDANRETAVPLYYCADISHGVADEHERVIADNWELFALEIPRMWEFHFKNTDGIFNSTFGFSPAERKKGIVDLRRLKELIDRNAARFPAAEITGYLELPGPKLGRDYTDNKMHRMLCESLEGLKEVFG
jgi:hypothetical protein